MRYTPPPSVQQALKLPAVQEAIDELTAETATFYDREDAEGFIAGIIEDVVMAIRKEYEKHDRPAIYREAQRDVSEAFDTMEWILEDLK